MASGVTRLTLSGFTMRDVAGYPMCSAPACSNPACKGCGSSKRTVRAIGAARRRRRCRGRDRRGMLVRVRRHRHQPADRHRHPWRPPVDLRGNRFLDAAAARARPVRRGDRRVAGQWRHARRAQHLHLHDAGDRAGAGRALPQSTHRRCRPQQHDRAQGGHRQPRRRRSRCSIRPGPSWSTTRRCCRARPAWPSITPTRTPRTSPSSTT